MTETDHEGRLKMSEKEATNQVNEEIDENQVDSTEVEDIDSISDEDACSVEEIEEAIAGFLTGDLTLAQLEGLGAEDLYGIADMGYDLLEEGRLEEALSIFEGLNVYNPFDPYFHSVLGSIYQRLDRADDALRHYESAVELYAEDINSWTNAGEIMLGLSAKAQEDGDPEKAREYFKEAIHALTRSIELDPEGKNASSLRARALVAVVAGKAEAIKKAS